MDEVTGGGQTKVVFYCTVYANSVAHWNKADMSGSSDCEEFYDAEDLTPNRSSRWKICITSIPVYNIQISLKHPRDIILTLTGRRGSDANFFMNIMCYINNYDIKLRGYII
jgi:hypothetical protein